MSNKEFPIEPSTIETIDTAMFNWLNKELNLFATTGKGWQKTPVIWVLGERTHQVKNNRDLRDSQGTFILPVITVERTSMNKDMNKKGIIWSAIPEYNDFKGGTIEIGKRINQEKSSNFAAAANKNRTGQLNVPYKNKKVVYQTISIPIPVYITVNYTIQIKTQFQQQMNELLQPFLTLTGGVNRFFIKDNGHTYESFFKSDVSAENTVTDLQENERTFSSKIEIETLGYLIGQDKNQAKPKVVIRENFVDVKVPRERIVIGDIDKEINKIKLS